MKNALQSSTACKPNFKAYLEEQLGVGAVSEVGYYLRASKMVRLHFSYGLVVVLQDRSAKGRSSIKAVAKDHEEDEHELVPKAKKKRSDVVGDRQQCV